ncbi:hypothetical protein KIPB_003701, partial [Kipferlia bialata]
SRVAPCLLALMRDWESQPRTAAAETLGFLCHKGLLRGLAGVICPGVAAALGNEVDDVKEVLNLIPRLLANPTFAVHCVPYIGSLIGPIKVAIAQAEPKSKERKQRLALLKALIALLRCSNEAAKTGVEGAEAEAEGEREREAEGESAPAALNRADTTGVDADLSTVRAQTEEGYHLGVAWGGRADAWGIHSLLRRQITGQQSLQGTTHNASTQARLGVNLKNSSAVSRKVEPLSTGLVASICGIISELNPVEIQKDKGELLELACVALTECVPHAVRLRGKEREAERERLGMDADSSVEALAALANVDRRALLGLVANAAYPYAHNELSAVLIALAVARAGMLRDEDGERRREAQRLAHVDTPYPSPPMSPAMGHAMDTGDSINRFHMLGPTPKRVRGSSGEKKKGRNKAAREAAQLRHQLYLREEAERLEREAQQERLARKEREAQRQRDLRSDLSKAERDLIRHSVSLQLLKKYSDGSKKVAVANTQSRALSLTLAELCICYPDLTSLWSIMIKSVGNPVAFGCMLAPACKALADAIRPASPASVLSTDPDAPVPPPPLSRDALSAAELVLGHAGQLLGRQSFIRRRGLGKPCDIPRPEALSGDVALLDVLYGLLSWVQRVRLASRSCPECQLEDQASARLCALTAKFFGSLPSATFIAIERDMGKFGRLVFSPLADLCRYGGPSALSAVVRVFSLMAVVYPESHAAVLARIAEVPLLSAEMHRLDLDWQLGMRHK